jgi:small subunit ribosomal protein S18
MMAFRSKSGPGTRKPRRPRIKDAAKCRFCREKAEEIDYKDLTVLYRLVSSQGKQFSRKRSGNCATHQRLARRALKRARFIGLLPFCG